MPDKPPLISRLDSRNLRRWLPDYLCQLATRPVRRPAKHRHLLFALCDHFEPLWNDPGFEVAEERVATWARGYPPLAAQFRDGDGLRPRHSLFYAGEEYHPRFLDALAPLVEDGLAEIELHLHHDGDNASGLASKIEHYCELFRSHGHLSSDRHGRLRFGFIHGNWCLANSRPDGRHCGVDDELEILWRAGCYADYTFPSAPDVTQPPTCNRIWWPGSPGDRAGHESGERARAGRAHRDRLLMVSGPLALTWDRARHRPRIENGALTGQDPPTEARVANWVAQGIHVDGNPDWVFVKVHTHGAVEGTASSLLGDGGLALHRGLQRFNDGERWTLHYVSAREMYNVIMAALDGCRGNPGDYRHYALPAPPLAD